MRMLMTSAIAALALAGSSLAGVTAANAAGFYVGPGGVRVTLGTGYYNHHRYFYPNDWRAYHHPMGWYRVHPAWYTERDWYRR